MSKRKKRKRKSKKAKFKKENSDKHISLYASIAIISLALVFSFIEIIIFWLVFVTLEYLLLEAIIRICGFKGIKEIVRGGKVYQVPVDTHSKFMKKREAALIKTFSVIFVVILMGIIPAFGSPYIHSFIQILPWFYRLLLCIGIIGSMYVYFYRSFYRAKQ